MRFVVLFDKSKDFLKLLSIDLHWNEFSVLSLFDIEIYLWNYLPTTDANRNNAIFPDTSKLSSVGKLVLYCNQNWENILHIATKPQVSKSFKKKQTFPIFLEIIWKMIVFPETKDKNATHFLSHTQRNPSW